MNDLEVKVSQQPGIINCNLEEIKEALKVQMTAYMDLEVTEGNIKESKSDLATLRKIKKAVDDRRKEVKKTFMKPYEDFETEVKSVLSIIDEPIGMIDGKLKSFEAKRVEEKMEHVKALYKENIGDFEEYLPFSAVAKSSWTNATCSDKDITYDIAEAVLRVKTDLTVIEGLKSEIHEQLIEVYKKTCNNLSAAVQKNTDYIEAKEAARKALEVEKMREKEIAEAPVQKVEEVIPELETIPEEKREVIFKVASDDAEKVKQFLDFSGITYTEG